MSFPLQSAGAPEFENHLRERRQALGLSQKRLADMAGITRQAVAAVEGNRYSPATSVALQLARALQCRVEDLFSIKPVGEIVEGELLGPFWHGDMPVRAQVTQIGDRLLVRPLVGVGELASLSATADGLIIEAKRDRNRVKVKLLKELETVRRKIVVAGCDPAIFLAADHFGKHDRDELSACLMGSSRALAALKRGEVHMAGIHLAEEKPDAWDLPNLQAAVGNLDLVIITFAHWEEGFIVRQDNPKKIRAVEDLARPTVRIVNRERGSGARRLLDKQLRTSGINPAQIKGYRDEVLSHLDIAARIKAGLADAGIGVRCAATICGLGFVPLQYERYDLIIPKRHYETLRGLKILLDIMVSKPFRDELESLGGYDTTNTGKFIAEIRSQ